MKNGPISFPDWKSRLIRAGLDEPIRSAYEREILTFLRYCKSNRAAAAVEVAKQFLAWREKQSAGPARAALRWFYREGARPPASRSSSRQGGQVNAVGNPETSQKQALNALVFLMQEALHRELGEREFKRAYPKERIPSVLSVPETRSLFAQMNGTTRLMAELAYGSGLRLLELLRLRIHHCGGEVRPAEARARLRKA
jgi:site-specific recombinase XerD